MTEQPKTGFIVVGVDRSERSADALRWALVQARHTGAAVRAITCWEEPLSVFLNPAHAESFYQGKVIEAFEQILAKTAEDAEGVDLQSRVVHGAAGTELTQEAEGADLLVIGCHTQIDRRGLHLGSVASYCAHHAPCPVLIFREPPLDQ